MPAGHPCDSQRDHPRAPVGRSNGSAGLNRDYYELALADGGVYRVFRDLDSGRWFVDGIYD
jgi:hypothetical protein